MSVKKLELNLPEELLDSLGSQQAVEKKVLEALVLMLVQEGTTSASHGAELLGISYHDMLDLMAEHNVPLVNYGAEAVDRGIDALEKYPQ